MRRQTVALLLPLVLLSLPASAQDPNLGHDGILFTLGNDQYIANDRIEMTEVSRGDVVALGRNIAVKALISGDLFAAGDTIDVESAVRDDVRIAGGDVTIGGDIDGDVVLFARTVRLKDGATITGDAVIIARTATIEGRVQGDVRVRAVEFNLLGTVNGSLDSRSERLMLGGTVGRNAILGAQQWYVGDRARIGGTLQYWQPQGERDFEGVLRGKTTYDETLAMQDIRKLRGDVLMSVLATFTLFSLFSGVFMIGILLLITKNFFRDTAKRLRAAPGKSLLYGFLYFVAAPFAILFFMMTLVGIPLALLLLAGYLFSLAFAKPLAAIILAKWIEQSVRTPLHGMLLFLLAIGIFIILKLLIVVPFFGWIALFLAVCSAFGALITTKWERWKKIR